MRVAIRHIAGHLVWSTCGSVWAIWRVDPVGGRYVFGREREEVLARVTSLVRSLVGAPRVFSLCARVDPAEIAERMTAGVDLERCPFWGEVVYGQLELLAGLEMHERTVWLAVPLESGGPRAGLTAAVGSTWAELSGLLGLRPGPVRAVEVAAYRQRAQQVAASLGSGLRLREARPAEIVWMYQHAVHRGLDEPLLGRAAVCAARGSRVVGGVLRSPSYADLGQVRLLEGGTGPAAGEDGRAAGEDRAAGAGPASAGAERGPWWRRRELSPLLRRWLQVETEAGTGYQAHLVLSEIPAAVHVDGADVLAGLEQLPFAVDAVVEMAVVPAETAKRQVDRKKKELVDQADQYGAQPAGLPESLREAAAELGRLGSRLGRSSVEVEVRSVTVLTVWGPSAAVCEERARELTALLSGADYRLVRPVGMQSELLALGLPGAAASVQVREFTQYQLSEDWAMCGAFTGHTVGDPVGAMIGVSLDAGTVRPVLLDVANAPKADASASVGVVGDLGSGKSVLQKQLISGVVDRGGRAIVIDRTPVREWAAFARGAAPGRCQVVDAAQAAISLDPLRVFPAAVGAHYALSYLTLQLGIGVMSPAGAVLNRAVKAGAARPDASMGVVLAELEAMATAGSDVGAAKRAAEAGAALDLLRVVADNPLAAAVFDPALAPVSLDGDLDSDFVVVTTAGLTLPPKEAFARPEALAQQPLEALIGRAVLYLIAAMARQVAFTDPARFCVIGMDECYWLTSSAEGLALVHEVVHDGRKHGAGVILGAHDAAELGDETTRGLLAYRFLARTTDQALARRGLAFLGLPDSEDLLRLVTTGLSPVGRPERAGEMLLRDPRTRTGLIQVLVPPVERIATGIFTTPGAAKPAAGRKTAAREQEAAAGAGRSSFRSAAGSEGW